MSNQSIPHHIAIICDGNRRWARERGWQVFRGHEYAADHTFEPLADRAAELGVEHLTFWVFSTENWERDQKEVEVLMNIFRRVFDEQIKDMHRKNFRVEVIGDRSRLDEDIQERIAKGEKLTEDNDGLHVIFALNYGGRDELTRAMRKLATQVKAGELQPVDITQATICEALDTADIPDPDLIIRTSGEHRLSGFMSWQHQYAEFYFPDVPYPEFTPEELDRAIEVFQSRQRRFGAD